MSSQTQKNFMPPVLEIIFSSYIQALKELEIPYEYYEAENGEVWTITPAFTMRGVGATLDESISDLLEALRENAEVYVENFAKWYKDDPQNLPLVLKILSSSNEELQQCLHGKRIDDI